MKTFLKCASNVTALILFLPFMVSCSSNSSGEWSEPKLEEFAKAQGIDLSKVEKLLVIPTEVTCESCVYQIVSFLNSLTFPQNVKFVLSSYSELSVQTFIKENDIQLNEQIYLDEDNYFFLNDLIMIHPVLFERKRGSLNKSELYPVNIAENLKNIFGMEGCNEKMIEEIFDLKIKGVLISKTDTDQSKSILLFRDIDDDQKQEEIVLSKESADLLLKYFKVNDFIQKSPKSFNIEVYEIVSEIKAINTKKTIKCK